MARALPVTAAGATLLGAALMVTALAAAPGPWSAGYVSEAGAAGRPFAMAYRTGLILLAAGVGLLSLTVLRFHRSTAALLGLAAVLAATSGWVPCTSRCPLPPFEPTTTTDVVHAGAAILGMVVLAAAMAVLSMSDLDRAVRRFAAVAVVLTVPIGAALGLAMLFVGRGPMVAGLERVQLGVAVAWLVGTAVLLSRSC